MHDAIDKLDKIIEKLDVMDQRDARPPPRKQALGIILGVVMASGATIAGCALIARKIAFEIESTVRLELEAQKVALGHEIRVQGFLVGIASTDDNRQKAIIHEQMKVYKKQHGLK